MKNIIYIFIVISLLISACDNINIDDKIREGQIDYEITYQDEEKNNPIIALLPTTMSFKFKNNSSIQKVEGWMGIFSMSGIRNADNDTYSATLKIMNEKYCYQTKDITESFGFDEMPGMKIDMLEETKEIAGHICKKAKVNFPGTDRVGFDIYYFDKVDLDNPNCHNPFRLVPGVIMEYQMTFQGIQSTLIATKVEEIEIDNNEFKVPDNYKMVGMEEIDTKIKSLM